MDISKFTDKYFKAAETKTSKKGEKEFFDQEKATKKELAADYIANQKVGLGWICKFRSCPKQDIGYENWCRYNNFSPQTTPRLATSVLVS